MGMKNLITYILTATVLFCSTGLSAWTGPEEESPAMQMLEAQKDSKRLDGAKV